MIASLMMYARPELAAAHGRFWQAVRQELSTRGIDAPETLSQDADEFTVWTAPDLVLSQTCGMPYRLVLHDKVTLVGTPDYGLDRCPPGYYRSPIVVRADDARSDLAAFRTAQFAYNMTISQSGFAAPYAHAKAHGFWFENTRASGSHVTSARMVAKGQADIAALDAVTWANIQRFEPFADRLRVLDWTTPTPGLPVISAIGTDADAGFSALQNCIEKLSQQDRQDLRLRGMVRIPHHAYLAVPNPPVDVINLDHHGLAPPKGT